MITLNDLDFMNVSEAVDSHISRGWEMVQDELQFTEHPDDQLERYKLAVEVAKLLQAEEHFWLSLGKGIE